MCRFIIYKGRTLLIEEVLIIPNNSMLVQSRCATYHPGVHDPKEHRNIRVNGDGFGVAWYCDDTCELGSCVLKFMTPAWSSSNLKNVARHVKAPLIMGHVRAASSGHNPHEKTIVSYENCHPFQYGRYTFMHNGGIPEFFKMKRPLCSLLRDELYHNITGTTDSEHIFALLLQLLIPDATPLPDGSTDASTECEEQTSVEEMARAVERTITILLELMLSNGIEQGCSLNLVLTDGCNIVATRFRNCPVSDAPSLYYTASPLDLYSSRLRSPSIRKVSSCIEYTGIVDDVGDLNRMHVSVGENLSELCGSPQTERKAVASFMVASEPQTVDEVSECLRFAENSSNSKAPGNITVSVDSKWHLIPNLHMMLCGGSAANLEDIKSVECRPIMIGTTFDCQPVAAATL